MASAIHSVSAESKPWAWRGQTLAEFNSDHDDKLEWRIVNDGVMGGLSKGNLEVTDAGTMKFNGTLSLENNGGFSTVRTDKIKRDLSNDLGLLLRVKGDGRTYEARLASDSKYLGMEVSFAGTFETIAGEWTQVKIPFTDFKGSFRGRNLPDRKLNPADIRRLGILLADKKSGEFNLEIDYIRTYGKGQGAGNTTLTAETAEETAEYPGGPKGLIATISQDTRLSTLKTALDTAGLTTFFQWDNKLTVFAPTNDAFAALPDGQLDALLKPENKDQLIALLKGHVASGEITSEKVKSANVKTLNGPVSIDVSSVIQADLTCSDGTIHIINSVLVK
ncbi:MAG: CIA30 family protein [Verrucomicrobiota bacterium]